ADRGGRAPGRPRGAASARREAAGPRLAARDRARRRAPVAARLAAGGHTQRLMARAFVLTGGSRSQLGLLENARALGHEVCVVDGAATAPLLAEADYQVVRSFADVEGVLADLAALGIEPAAVATMGSDLAVLPTARLAERLGLPGLPVETAQTVADKRRMRAAFQRAGVRTPRGRDAGAADEARTAFAELGPPLVVKPVDGSGQRGVTEVRAERELDSAVERALAASRAGAIVLEQYVEGDEYTVNGFLLG